MEERERKLRVSWRRRPPFIGASKSNRYVLFLHNRYYRMWERYYRSGFRIRLQKCHVGHKRYYHFRYHLGTVRLV
jgi:hypothetical protein